MPTETAYAKVNLALHVRRRREDGYHDIESLFAFVDSGDVLRAERRDDGELKLTIDGPFAAGLDDGPDNLVLRAADALTQSACPERSRGTYAQPSAERPSTTLGNTGGRDAGAVAGLGADLYLTKNLPVASGIGGGSADAAAALRLLNRLWGCGLDDAALCAIGETLGSDIPACVISGTLRVEGRGEALQPLDLAGLAGMPILLVNPGVPLGTAPVFKGWDQHDRGALDSSSLAAVIEGARNDLEPPARALVPEIGAVLDVLAVQGGVQLARMSGSGATCFALFDRTEDADAACHAIQRAYPDWWTMGGVVR
ncbi:4-(cytidine 5'-diphospho)-2-C-methyl-D-erythritol kinase [Blastomonas sp.]|uniref:4-(cytidine 5'-diphospho)-2-C-methyl-D-erythritol kinase n=1 Tax=Blastomonas sp. TaxID=1909299 RepID=UPI0026105CFF|nr:4-(cytidine 5'-diphospho)-2-C-methyl-D-erythritol kinase [Blastomonas sp.]MDM7956285.1 4-(cytidine 5'-diphospho)-2-C-methyl-D-erythritol kinase [Blastomonas sp.]